MHIAVLLEELTAGGVERTSLKLIGGLLRLGHKVDLLLLRSGGALEAEVPEGVRVVILERSGHLTGRRAVVRADPLGLPWLARGVLLARSTRLSPMLFHLESLARYLTGARPDILLAAKLWPNLCAVWARELAATGTAVVLTVRSSMRELDQSRRCEQCRALMLRYYPRAERIVTVSGDLVGDLAGFTGIAADRITPIYNAVVDETLEAGAAADADHPWLEADQPPVILGVGRLVPRKGFDTLLRAFARVRQERMVRLIILGNGKTAEKDESFTGELLTLARDLGVADDVALPGFRRNPFAFMARAAVFVLPSHFEGLPGVLIQAMACGCPVVSTDCPTGPREILEGGRFGPLVPVNDDAAMARAISGVLDAPLAAQVLRERAGRFSVSAAAGAYQSLFREITSLAPRARPAPALPILAAVRRMTQTPSI